VLILRFVSLGVDSQTPSIEQRLLTVAGKKLVNEKTILADGKFDFGTTRNENSGSKDGPFAVKGKERNLNAILSLFSAEQDLKPGFASSGEWNARTG